MLGKESAKLGLKHKFLYPLRCADDLINEQTFVKGAAAQNLIDMQAYVNPMFESIWELKNALIFLPYNTGYDFETLI